MVDVARHVVVVTRVVHVREHQTVATADIRLQDTWQRDARYQPIAIGVFGIGIASSLSLRTCTRSVSFCERGGRFGVAIRHGIVVLGCGIAAVLDQAMWMKDEDLNRQIKRRRGSGRTSNG